MSEQKTTETKKRRGKDIAGIRFGKLTAIEPTSKRLRGSVVWKCQCDCGNIVEVPYSQIVRGNVRSCGCLKKNSKGPGQYMTYKDGTCLENIRFSTNHDRLRKNNKSGITGVSRYRDKWRAALTFQKKTYYLGVFDTLDEAVEARRKAEEKFFLPYLSEEDSASKN